MTPEELSMPPTEADVAAVVHFLSDEASFRAAGVVRRLAFQRDALLTAAQLHVADIAAVESLNAELRAACELLLHVAENGITHVIDVMPAVDAARGALTRSSTGAS